MVLKVLSKQFMLRMFNPTQYSYMNYTHLKSMILAFGMSIGTAQLAIMEGTADATLVNTIVQTLIGILTIIGFFRHKKKLW